MKRRLAAVTLACAALAAAAELHAQQVSPRDIWPQATTAAIEGDFAAAETRTAALIATGRTHGVRTFPVYAASAAGLASEAVDSEELRKWALATAATLDPRSAAVAFSEADRAARGGDWQAAIAAALQGLRHAAASYRRNLITRADLLIVGALAVVVTAILFAIALFIRYGRSMAHDFRETLSAFFSGGTVTVLAFALLFLPLFLWLGPMWLIFYWFVIFFGYAGLAERIAIAVLLILVALLPIIVDAAAHAIAGVESPVMIAAISSANQSYQPEALRRIQELIAVVPDNAVLHLLAGNMQAFEGLDAQAAQHYRRAIELDPSYAGAHVNLGNLLFLDNEFQAAITEYARAQQFDPELAIAYYNSSVASGETYKFDQQARMLEAARRADASVIERLRRNPPPQKVVMYAPPIAQAWDVNEETSRRPAARALFGNYSAFDPRQSAANPMTIGAIAALLLAIAVWAVRRRSGFANACIKCGRTFCHRCKSARESTTYCTQCIHIYLKRDGVSLDTKRKKLEEVGGHHAGMVRRNRLFATFLPGSAQMLEGRTAAGVFGAFAFFLLVAIAILVGRLGPALGPSAEFAQLLVRLAAIVFAVVVWTIMSVPVYRRRAVS